MRRSRLNRPALFETLEDRRLLSAALEAAHVAPARPAGTVYTFATQPSTGRPSLTAGTSHTKGVPVLNSRPGAAYTVFLDFAGFNYVGDWNGRSAANGDMLPGFTPAYNDASPTGTFTAAEKKAITTVWTRMAQSYSSLDVNVTTVDPAPAAIQSDDVARKAFYDATPNMMHTVIGSGARAEYVDTTDPDDKATYNPGGNWVIGADGISPGLGIASGRVDGPNALEGQHTNFMMSQGHADNGGSISNTEAEYVGGISAHENAHSFGLAH